MPPITVATYNTWNCQGRFDRRLNLMAAGLKALDADIVLLQEVFAQAPSGLDAGRRLADELGMFLAYQPARKKLRKINGAPILGHSGLAVLSKTPPLATASVRLPSDPRDGERLGQLVRLTVKDLSVCVANVHLTHLSGADELRAAQLTALTEKMRVGNDLGLVGGDMNAPLGHGLFGALAGFQGVSFENDPPVTTLNPVAGETSEAGVIDHIYVKCGGGKATLRARTALDMPDPKSGLFPSDHMAVVAEIGCG